MPAPPVRAFIKLGLDSLPSTAPLLAVDHPRAQKPYPLPHATLLYKTPRIHFSPFFVSFPNPSLRSISNPKLLFAT
jgi:hypothetical protein